MLIGIDCLWRKKFQLLIDASTNSNSSLVLMCVKAIEKHAVYMIEQQLKG